MEQENLIQQTPPPLPQQQEEDGSKGQFALTWGIVSCVASLIIYFLIIISIAASLRTLAVVVTILCVLFLVFSIFTLLCGIKGIKIKTNRVKAIIGTAFSGQNILAFAIMTCMGLFAIFASHPENIFEDIDPDYTSPAGLYDDYNDYDDIYEESVAEKYLF